ncbi:protein phosphatase 2C domain-containing protein [Thalassoglobus sp. JC818]|uniref:PP2C family protein-serine/threonine phosphatase n=1 Tax=Thalassoglobus sp. JC818 TaxID=3232136 RepID=UPI0034574118
MTDSSELTWGSVSITGNFRENNEDRLFIHSDGRYFLIADGMGGQSAGEKASELAVELISKRLDQTFDWDATTTDEVVVERIDQAIEYANSEIMALGEIEPKFRSMGTTITFIVRANQSFYIGGVGDSRTYQLRNDEFRQLTEDHSLTQALVKAGTISPADAETHRYKNVLYRYLGSKDGAKGSDAVRIAPQSGDQYLLCTDGVSDGVSDEQMQEILVTNDDPQAAADALVKAAQDGGSKDNITCIVLYVQ